MPEPTPAQSICEQCHQPFARSRKGPAPRWCGSCRYDRQLRKARARHAESLQPRPCRICGTDLRPIPGVPRSGQFCSLECRRRAKRAHEARWRENNPDGALEKWQGHKQRRRAAKQGAPVIERFWRSTIYKRDGWICGICRDPVDPLLKYPDPRSSSLDHVVPLSKGGAHTRENVRLAHLRCNCLRQNRLDEVS